MSVRTDLLLAFWLVTTLIADLFILSGTAYIVFWLEYSGWWFLLTCLLLPSPTLIKALKVRFKIGED